MSNRKFTVVVFSHPDCFSGTTFDNQELVLEVSRFDTLEEAEERATEINRSWETVAQVLPPESIKRKLEKDL